MITRGGGLIFTATGIGLTTSTIWLGFSALGVTLEPPPFVRAGNNTTLLGGVLLVNPAVRNEEISNGSERAPFKTITQALQVAQPNTVILLATGTYSTSSGEAFPLQLKQGVSIQGDPRTRGSKIVIQGGGTFLSPTFARQNVTILGANQASLTGVTVTNPNPRGYGLWIESSSPVVIDNTFTRNSHDGISITGNSTPTIRSNYFYQNGANGMTVYGTSRAEVRENVFEKTGFGINIAQKAAPMLVDNRITQNRTGIVIQAKARPVLRGNVIEGNTEDGVVAIANSQPDLGTKTEPGGNVFRQNGRYDINSSASNQFISAYGNQLTNARTSGKIDLAGTAVAATPAEQAFSNPQLAQTPETRGKKQSLEIPVIIEKEQMASQFAGQEVSDTTTLASIEIPVPPPVSMADLPPASGSDTVIEIPIPPTASNQVAPPPQVDVTPALPVLKFAPIVSSNLLPVPSLKIPVGNTRNLPKVALPGLLIPAAGSPPSPPRSATALGLRYRVVVEAESESQQALVRSLVPGAFRITTGRVLMQAGAFSDRANADEIQQMLNSKGLRATVEQIN